MKLRDYQWQIADYVVENPRCLLFVPMGLGKSVSTLTAITMLELLDAVFPVLVIAPLRVARSTWPDEIAKWAHTQHLRVSCILGSAKERQKALAAPADIYTINYENLAWLAETLGDNWPFKMIVADECSKLKGHRARQGTQRAKALAKYAHKTPRFVGLTGTPSPNGVQDLWGQAWFVDQGHRLGKSFDAFKSRWFQSERVGNSPHAVKLQPLPGAQREIETLIKDVCLTLAAEDHFDLAEPIVNIIKPTLPFDAMRRYKEMEQQMFTTLEQTGALEAFNPAAKTMKCLQLANGAVYVDEDSEQWEEVHVVKLDVLASIIEEAQGAPIIVAYHFRTDLERLKKAFPQGRHLDKNPKTIDDWNAGKIPLLFAHPQSAGHGLNLAAGGNILVFFSVNWNLEEHLQIIERIGPTRQAQLGTGRATFLHYIIAEGTIDELVLERLRTKKSVQDVLLEALKTRSKA